MPLAPALGKKSGRAFANLSSVSSPANLGRSTSYSGRAALAVARRRDRDDVAFALSDGRVAVVHLTWSSRRELPGWPSHVFHPTMDAFIAATALSGDET